MQVLIAQCHEKIMTTPYWENMIEYFENELLKTETSLKWIAINRLLGNASFYPWNKWDAIDQVLNALKWFH